MLLERQITIWWNANSGFQKFEAGGDTKCIGHVFQQQQNMGGCKKERKIKRQQKKVFFLPDAEHACHVSVTVLRAGGAALIIIIILYTFFFFFSDQRYHHITKPSSPKCFIITTSSQNDKSWKFTWAYCTYHHTIITSYSQHQIIKVTWAYCTPRPPPPPRSRGPDLAPLCTWTGGTLMQILIELQKKKS